MIDDERILLTVDGKGRDAKREAMARIVRRHAEELKAAGKYKHAGMSRSQRIIEADAEDVRARVSDAPPFFCAGQCGRRIEWGKFCWACKA